MPTHVDVLIVGAGISGIAAARHLQMRCPGKRFAILEARDTLGGTWDLFRYPGVRSDSDMHTMGFSFRPWAGRHTIAQGADILRYLHDTARAFGIDRTIRFHHRVTRAEWNSANAQWTVHVSIGAQPEPSTYTCAFLFMCSGYYDYAGGHSPDFPGIERFRGLVLHPQQWPRDASTSAYAGKRVVVIGSGATAVTLVPAMAQTAAHVTMLQRSPSWIASMPKEDAISRVLRRWLPHALALRLTRWKNIVFSIVLFQLARRRPTLFGNALLKRTAGLLGPDFDIATHFTPTYKPWDQRLCVVPDADLFTALRSGRADIVTDHIQHFTQSGITLASGKHLDADVVVTATGLKVHLLGGMQLVVDGSTVNLADTVNYKGAMFSGVPNFALTVGYTNATWTLKAELTATFVCRLLRYMDRHKLRKAVPLFPGDPAEAGPIIDFSSGYIQRALPLLPRQGATRPWRLYQNYPLDILTLRYGKLNDGTLHFSR